jgi:hypothetical protein
MQQPHEREVTVYADITEVRMGTRVADCKKLLAAGWVLLGLPPDNSWGTRTQEIPEGADGGTASGHPAACAAHGWLCYGK